MYVYIRHTELHMFIVFICGTKIDLTRTINAFRAWISSDVAYAKNVADDHENWNWDKLSAIEFIRIPYFETHTNSRQWTGGDTSIV